MNSYDFLAGCYDELTYDVDYSAWADYVEKQFRRPLPGKTVLDLACGTGSLTRELAERGYEMIGVDQSPEMLAAAVEKNENVGGIPPMFLCQSMEKLDLYGTIDACVCCLDSVNYVTSPQKLQKAFQRVHLFLMPGGLFLFDVNTPEKLAGAKKDLAILHPLPRVNEIAVAIDADPRACYFKQVLNGKFMRMALILKLLEVQ